MPDVRAVTGVSSKSTYKDMRAKAKLPERTVEVCFRGDLVAEFEGLERELEQIPKTDSLDSGSSELLERMEALRSEMRESTYPVRLRAMPRPAYRELTAQHAARRDDDGKMVEEDAQMGVNTETFYPALLRASIVDPELSTTGEWTEFDEGLTDYQWSELAGAAFLLNRGPVTIPFSLAASRMNRSSGGE